MKTVIFLVVSMKFVIGRDFYMGMFKKNDYLVAQDTLYKDAVPHTFTYAKYGRYFKCPITYFRVVDRLGMGRGPTVQIVRGGLQKKYIVVRIKSPYNLPISVNIYAGCQNKRREPFWRRPTKATTLNEETKQTTGDKVDADTATTSADVKTDGTSATGGGVAETKPK